MVDINTGSNKDDTISNGNHQINSKPSSSYDIGQPHQRHFALAGLSSGCLTRFLCQPLDVLKIRLQLQIEPISRTSESSKYRSVAQTFTCIIREESLFALWKGHVSAQILSGIYGMVSFSSFELFKRISSNWISSHQQIISQDCALLSQPLINFFCGSLSGFCATLFSHPFDVVRTRIISQSEHPKTYLSTYSALKSIAYKEGLNGFYRGFLPMITQIMPLSGIQFASYHLFKKLWRQQFQCDHYPIQLGLHLHFNIQSSFICGAMAGTVAKFLVYPLDLIKKRLMIRGFEHARGSNFGKVPHYKGFVHCIVHTMENENLAAFYKGLLPSLFKANLTTALYFWLYESILLMMIKADESRQR